MVELQDRHVAVIGLGESGLAMARWAAFKGAKVTVLDDREAPPQKDALLAQCPQAKLVLGKLSLAATGGADLLAWSPGLSPLAGAASSLYQAAVKAGLPVLGEIDFFADELARRAQEGYRPRVIAITGTNGKTTVTQLAGHLAAEAGLDVQMAGNISPAMLEALRERVLQERLPQIWVLELSSFQLALAGNCAEASRLHCTASVVLNVSQDHLDWHQTMAHYRDAKLRIHQDSACCVVNADDPQTDPASPGEPAAVNPRTAGVAAAAGAAPKRTARAKVPRATGPVAQASFSLSAPASAPAFGVVRDSGLNWLVEALPEDDSGARRRRGATAGGFHLNRLMPADALRLHGAHNHANALAALMLLRAAGVALAPMLRGLRDFEAGPHRCRLVAVVQDVEYYDDSKGTNVGATVAALSGLGKRCVLIAGGLGKGQDFSPLAPAVRRHARAVVLIGRDAPLIRQALARTGVPLQDAATMEDAVEKAAQQAAAGDAVLMSPACASFDMFRGYPHRSEVFVAAVTRLAQEAGQPC
ncbi:MAG: UDP-N-acetylmuramoyl-L-alanine--D-glutamate ligase [Lautropia sp.]|nr:UDP-N-acetylmuramoyl-L-alanine--D-glutamate ligase [Lautropia sp.]